MRKPGEDRLRIGGLILHEELKLFADRLDKPRDRRTGPAEVDAVFVHGLTAADVPAHEAAARKGIYGRGDDECAGLGDRLAQQLDERGRDARIADASRRKKKLLHHDPPGHRRPRPCRVAS